MEFTNVEKAVVVVNVALMVLAGLIIYDMYYSTPASVDNPAAVNVSFGELKAFLASDITDATPYSMKYNCKNFSADLHNRAEAAGIASTVVRIVLWPPPGHAVTGFNTTDMGEVWIDNSVGADTQVDITDEGIIRTYSLFDERAWEIENRTVVLVHSWW